MAKPPGRGCSIGALRGELWPGRDPPALIGQHWDNLKEFLRYANEGWDVWIDWYEARLDGRIRSQEVELAYVNYTKNVLSTASAWEANSEIKRLIELASPNLIVPTGTLNLTAGTASFAVGDNLSAKVVTSAPPPAGPPPIESIPEQERIGTRFGMDAQGLIDVLQTPPTIDQLQRFHYEEMRHKAEALAGLGQMLGDITPAIARTLEALPAQIEDASIDRLWSRANTLRRRHDAHVRAIDNSLGPDPARLHSLVAAHLGDFVDSFNVYVIGDPRGLELDRIRLGPQDREAARKVAALAAPIAHALNEPELPATPAAQETLTEQIDAAIDAPDDINGDQAAELARKTAGNFVSELLRRAYAPIHKYGAAATKGVSDGFYRAVGGAVFTGLSGAAYFYWPAISSFVVRNADVLRAFVSEAYHNPKIAEIIDAIVRAAGHQ